jgi:hypothetical protein
MRDAAGKEIKVGDVAYRFDLIDAGNMHSNYTLKGVTTFKIKHCQCYSGSQSFKTAYRDVEDLAYALHDKVTLFTVKELEGVSADERFQMAMRKVKKLIKEQI